MSWNRREKCKNCGREMMRLYAVIQPRGNSMMKTVGWICPRCLYTCFDPDAKEKVGELEKVIEGWR